MSELNDALIEEHSRSAVYPTGIGQLVITREMLRQCD